jgi:hypothetical protein
MASYHSWSCPPLTLEAATDGEGKKGEAVPPSRFVYMQSLHRGITGFINFKFAHICKSLTVHKCRHHQIMGRSANGGRVSNLDGAPPGETGEISDTSHAEGRDRQTACMIISLSRPLSRPSPLPALQTSPTTFARKNLNKSPRRLGISFSTPACT